MLPIANIASKEESHIVIRFMAELVEENISFDKEEILDVKWFEIEEIKKMKREELRRYDVNIKTIYDVENNNIYPLELFDNNTYNG